MVNLVGYFETTKHALDGGEVVLKQRQYLGMSQLGHECSRFLWYQFRWFFIDKTSPRMVRLWNRGHREEPVLIKELEKIGIKCSGDQMEMIHLFGHIQGHRDGIAIGVIEAPKTEHLLEFKTLSDKHFKELKKKKLKAFSKKYYGQCQLYMRKGKLERTLFIAVNKNDDEIYIERLKLDRGYADDLLKKGENIVLAELPPDRAFSSETYFECKWCPAKSNCWQNKPAAKSCRSCRFSGPNSEGGWTCYWNDANVAIPIEIQRRGCGNYQYLLNSD